MVLILLEREKKSRKKRRRNIWEHKINNVCWKVNVLLTNVVHKLINIADKLIRNSSKALHKCPYNSFCFFSHYPQKVFMHKFTNESLPRSERRRKTSKWMYIFSYLVVILGETRIMSCSPLFNEGVYCYLPSVSFITNSKSGRICNFFPS